MTNQRPGNPKISVNLSPRLVAKIKFEAWSRGLTIEEFVELAMNLLPKHNDDKERAVENALTRIVILEEYRRQDAQKLAELSEICDDVFRKILRDEIDLK
ncbi:MAG: hypothetical protein JGK17_32460 [Microcoleus sp. PH2017_10_PVI_O_A]|uniref:hypothetical protein n=1 Tax=unclassified Microcoleus TaxID=2642155 RepID=UPI001DA42D57|nr:MULTISPECIES: hypothetical protein [unclassified Microcoleus]TAE75739.1 MAG: hypothetical protein EAZ83_29045 [Oscillatoriales cyanobacterium]MCC3410162.1 hypothetical protein [Microcoleus sp. PH2017_10_PVI_O_A]MCC3464429.1 hypothetical protein [Microcoleus sp. PH2017_11_PCY_U_A]MCC3482359.1 hypothetical protein [Microcoleus sp. PH2017_12_PCY_D_A]MCC3563734.1 hypothetical protein [Microcoleus sp. PH2017_27_LUM_O_A]